jgi:acetyl esterase/lipase
MVRESYILERTILMPPPHYTDVSLLAPTLCGVYRLLRFDCDDRQRYLRWFYADKSPWDAQEFYRALKERNVPVEFVAYPRENHGFTEPGHRLDRAGTFSFSRNISERRGHGTGVIQ